MKVEVFTIGRPRLAYARLGVEEYLKRLQKYSSVALRPLKRPAAMEAELKGYAGFKVVLDERGEELTTLELARRYRGWKGQHKRVGFFIGPAEGHAEAALKSANWVMALSRLTLQHELALLVLMEQLYRVETLLAGHPYHRT